MKSIALTTSVALLALAGCAATPDKPAEDKVPASELVYRTGSNIPVRQAPLSKEEKERQSEEAKRTMESMQRTGAGVPQK